MLNTLPKTRVSHKLEKCKWLSPTVEYLGHEVTTSLLSINEAHTKLLREMQHPKTLTKLCIAHFSSIAICMDDLSHTLLIQQHHRNLSWRTDSQLISYNPTNWNPPRLRNLSQVSYEPPLSHFQTEFSCSLTMLMQVMYESALCTFIYTRTISKNLFYFGLRTLTRQNAATRRQKKEYLAVVWGLQILWLYRQKENCMSHSDRVSSIWLMRIAEPPGRLMRWRLRLI